MRLFKPPMEIPKKEHHYHKLFLAGSIEMGTADNWQDEIVDALEDRDVIIYNPRRDDWDSSWVQSINNSQFKEQVIWELDGMHNANMICFYFDPNTKSPITLLELGLWAYQVKNIIVCCPEGFWRKGNVDIVCDYYGLKQFQDLESMKKYLRWWTYPG